MRARKSPRSGKAKPKTSPIGRSRTAGEALPPSSLGQLTAEFSRRLNDVNAREDEARGRLDAEFRAATSATAQGAQAWQTCDDGILAARDRREQPLQSAHDAREAAFVLARAKRSAAFDENNVGYRNALEDADKKHTRAREDAQIELRARVAQIEREHPVLREQLPLIRAAERVYQEALDKAALAHRRADDDARDAMQRRNDEDSESERRETSRANDAEAALVESAGASYQRDDKNSKARLMNALTLQAANLVRDYNAARATMAGAFAAEREEVHAWFVLEREKLP